MARAMQDVERCRGNLAEYIRRSWSIIEPSVPFVSNWHLDCICEHLKAIRFGWIENLIINVPPGFSKSLTCNVSFPSHTWTEAPETRFMFASYSQELATRDSLKCREIISSPWYQARWGNKFSLSDDQNLKTMYHNSAGGWRLSTSVGGRGTGEHPDCVSGDTLVATERGDIAIRDLYAMKDRPKVWTINADVRAELKPIVSARIIKDSHTIIARTDSGIKLQCTGDHKIANYRDWKFFPARSTYGMLAIALSISGGDVSLSKDIITSIELSGTDTVYDIQVEGNHNFFANGLLVHNCLIIDDPCKADEALSDAEREAANSWWTNTISTRGVSRGVRRLIIMQRLHERDLTGYALESGNWTHLVLPMEYDPSRRCVTVYKDGDGIEHKFEDPRKTEGELLWPELFNASKVASVKAGLRSAYNISSQLQQLPAPAGGGLFKRSHFRYWREESTGIYTLTGGSTERRIMAKDLRKVMFADTAMTEKKEADYSVIQVWGYFERIALLLDQWRGQVEAPEMEQMVSNMRARWTPMFVGMEDVPHSRPSIQRLIRSGIPMKAMKPEGKDKKARAATIAVLVENGRIYFPQDAGWLGDFEHEVLLFPKGSNDDAVDTAAYFGLWFDQQGSTYLGPNSVTVEDYEIEL